LDEDVVEIEISHHLPQASVPDTIKSFLEVDEVVVEVALVLEVLLY
jgi:hypothetical protein